MSDMAGGGDAAAAESADARLRRLRMRSWRRGIKEMDLILGRFADTALADLSGDELALYDTLLEENDQDLYDWVSGRATPPFAYLPLVARIAAHAGAR
ncbi:MAG: succinate dehydrogenase assembly factor 2 [Paracoccaceae bacterium]|jgi:antitoxin CptB|nr:succinate dehydrogenase assembly factor 2 [Paracoccaceae bacterium]